jgi:c-di-GMP-binding flagellar brake protein YcgR
LEDRRKTIRRQADQKLLQRVKELEALTDRRVESGRDEAGHMRRRAIRHNCTVGISMSVGHSSGYLDTWTVDSVKVPGRLLDLSPGGAALFTEQRFETGQELQLTIGLRDGSEIHTKAAIRWVKVVPQKGGYASGVQFSQVSGKDQTKIAEFLAELDATAGL